MGLLRQRRAFKVVQGVSPHGVVQAVRTGQLVPAMTATMLASNSRLSVA